MLSSRAANKQKPSERVTEDRYSDRKNVSLPHRFKAKHGKSEFILFKIQRGAQNSPQQYHPRNDNSCRKAFKSEKSVTPEQIERA